PIFHSSDLNSRLATATHHLSSSTLKSSGNAINVAEHLLTVYDQLDWHGQDLDALLVTTKIAPPQLIGQLMELELLGVISVQGGRYLRV
ncbi:DNA-processing protein DprA, partial [Psychrobacter sp. 1U2]